MTSDDEDGLPTGLGAPARRALAAAGVTRLEHELGIVHCSNTLLVDLLSVATSVGVAARVDQFVNKVLIRPTLETGWRLPTMLTQENGCFVG